MSIEIKRYINVNQADIQAKNRNIFIGISLGNKYFSKENLREYILWALENTKDDVLVLIADKNRAVNYEILNGYTKDRALAVALRKGEEKKKETEEIISELPDPEKKRVSVITWEVAQKGDFYVRNIQAVLNEFETNEKFQKYILNILDENLGERTKDLTLEEKKKLAKYILDEIPPLLHGIEYDNKIYTLHPYPGFSSLDYLFEGLANKTLFPELAQKINFQGELPAMAEAFVKEI